MSVQGKFELNITTDTQEEMDLIMEAIHSGFAANIIKQHVLWPQFMAPALQPSGPSPGRVVGPGPELQRVDSKARAVTPPPAPTKKERSVGIIGRGRMGRTQK